MGYLSRGLSRLRKVRKEPATEAWVREKLAEAPAGSGSSAWADITGKPSTFTPSAHTHSIANVTGLQAALDGKQASGSYAAETHTHTASQISDSGATGRSILAAATAAVATAILSVFTSAAKGLVPASGGGTVNFLRADGTWAAPAGGAPNYDGYTQMVPAATAWVSNAANATALGTQAQVQDRTIIAPFVTAYGMTIDQVAVSVSALLAGANAKVVIFAADSNGRPTTLLRESGNISAAANNTVGAAITPLALTAGATYWIGIRASGTFTLRTLPVGALPALDYTVGATPAARQVLIRTETFASAATDWTYAVSQHSNALMPLVLMRVA